MPSNPSQTIRAQLLRDLEAFPDLSCKDLCDRRPETYGTSASSLRRSTQNKYRYLKSLKKGRPDHYWKLYTRATISYPKDKQPDQEKEDKEQEPLWSSPARQEPGVDEPAARSFHASWRPTPTRPFLQNQRELTSRDSPIAMSFVSPPRNNRESAHHGNFFETIAEAEGYVNTTTTLLDLDFPEKNGEFFVHHISNVKATVGNELIDLLKITLPHLIDLRDFKNYSGHVVLGGQGFLISMPSVPHYLLHDYKELFESGIRRCPRTEENYTVARNNILASPARQVKRVLLLFPDGMTCVADLSATAPSSTDQKVKMTLRTLMTVRKVKRGNGQFEIQQTFTPGSWVLHVINRNRRILNLDENDLKTAFAGMNISL